MPTSKYLIYMREPVLRLFLFVLAMVFTAFADAAPNVVVVISDVDPALAANDRKLLRTGIFDTYRIIDPRNLNDLADKLMAIGRIKKIDTLFIMGHGNNDGIQFRRHGESFLTAQHFRRLEAEYPSLPQSFSRHASVELFHCLIGSNDNFLEAAGRAFLGIYGGQVIASDQETSSDHETVDYPDGSHVTYDVPSCHSLCQNLAPHPRQLCRLGCDMKSRTCPCRNCARATRNFDGTWQCNDGPGLIRKIE